MFGGGGPVNASVKPHAEMPNQAVVNSIVARLVTAVLLLAGSVTVDAQQAGRVYRIGFVSPHSASPNPQFDAFRGGLRELGMSRVETSSSRFDSPRDVLTGYLTLSQS